jgi:hypothetical protein
MTLPRTVADVLAEHVVFEVESIDRMYLNAYVPGRDLRALTAQLRGPPDDAVTAGQMTYDLLRLRLHGLIQRLPHTHRYHVTDTGLPTAIFLARVHDRFLPTGLANSIDPASSGPLRAATTRYVAALDTLARRTALAA